MELMNFSDKIVWRIHLSSPKENVFDILATDGGRGRFWAEQTTELDGVIRFQFGSGLIFESKVLETSPPDRFSIEYFGGSQVSFDLDSDNAGGTDLTLTESGVHPENRMIHYAGWIPVLLALKAAVDFSIDLRNHDPDRTWDRGYVDV